jgi:hypothetical protein
MFGRAASFCAAPMTQNDGSHFDQGIAFWQPNGTSWLQPPVSMRRAVLCNDMYYYTLYALYDSTHANVAHTP